MSSLRSDFPRLRYGAPKGTCKIGPRLSTKHDSRVTETTPNGGTLVTLPYLFIRRERRGPGARIVRDVNLKGIWPRRTPKAPAVHAAAGLGDFFFFFSFLIYSRQLQARSHGGGARGAQPPLEKFEPPLGCPP